MRQNHTDNFDTNWLQFMLHIKDMQVSILECKPFIAEISYYVTPVHCRVGFVSWLAQSSRAHSFKPFMQFMFNWLPARMTKPLKQM